MYMHIQMGRYIYIQKNNLLMSKQEIGRQN